MRLPAPIRAEHESGERRDRAGGAADESPGGGRIRKLLVGATLVALAYLAWRRLRTGPAESRPGDGAGGGVGAEAGTPVPIDGPSGAGPTGEPPDEAASAVDPTMEEVDERVEDDVEGTPAEPGEVAVSEEVAEEAGEATGDEADGATDEGVEGRMDGEARDATDEDESGRDVGESGEETDESEE